MSDDDSGMIQPTRREALYLGGAALGTLAAAPSFARGAECILTSTQIDAPYHIKNAESRRDLRSGKPGIDLSLRIEVVEATTCDVIGGASRDLVLRRARQLQRTSRRSPQQPAGPRPLEGFPEPQGPHIIERNE